MFDKIVVGWDDTPSARDALHWAVDRTDGVPLVVVQVMPGREQSGEQRGAEGSPAEARIGLMEVTDEVREANPELRLTTATVHGDPLRELDDYLTKGTLIVVGAASHGRSSRWTLGSRLAGRPGGGSVAVIPEGLDRSARSGIVVGVDGSAASLEAIGIGVDEAARSGEPLTLVHVWRVPTEWQSVYDDYAEDVAVVQDMHRQILDDALDIAASRGAAAEGRLEEGGAAAELIFAAKDASLLVVGSHGRNWVGRFLIGSVSHDVLVSMPSPTIVVRPGE
ncbi:universal stress protein [Agromyces sp. ISL-38]|uniref:universal stress protein n=1 Tax=Agromyces sp. ISL-38 TaxID=2819107 RepID=UPI001BEA4D23|nr:universal stress protein [Agromyces sp. ISL-38]MBT2497811.1 universal stress protein [Agromyces sp. ISL-38]MBT2517101.1 universal stress protein [Streptomyces sp. ISL-90]